MSFCPRSSTDQSNSVLRRRWEFNSSRGHFMWKRLLIPFGISVITLVGLALAVRSEGLPSRQTLYAIQPLWFLLAAIKVPLLFPLWVWRWRAILRVRYPSVQFSPVMVGVWVRSFFNNIMPGVGGSGGEVAGAYYLHRRLGIPFRETVATAAVERMIMGLTLVVLMVIGLGVTIPLLPLGSTTVRSILIGLLAFTLVVGLALYVSVFRFEITRRWIKAVIRFLGWVIPPLRRKTKWSEIDEALSGFKEVYQDSFRNRGVIFWVVLITLAQIGLELLQPYAVFRALGVQPPFWTIILTMASIKVLAVFSPIPGDSGLVEGINFGVYASLSAIPQQIIVAHTVLFRILDAWLLWIISGIVTSMVSVSMLRRNN